MRMPKECSVPCIMKAKASVKITRKRLIGRQRLQIKEICWGKIFLALSMRTAPAASQKTSVKPIGSTALQPPPETTTRLKESIAKLDAEDAAARKQKEEMDRIAAAEKNRKDTLDAELKAGDDAIESKRFRKALTHYAAALRYLTPDESGFSIREKIIASYRQMKPRPRLSEDVKVQMLRGEAAAETAKTPREMQDAIAEYQKALGMAPWSAMLYYNLGTLEELNENYKSATEDFKLYQEAAPNATDKEEITKKIIKLDYLSEKAQKAIADQALAAKMKQAAAKQRAEQFQTLMAGLLGAWGCSSGCVSGNITQSGAMFTGSVDTGLNSANQDVVINLSGTFDGLTISGTATTPQLYDSTTQCTVPSGSNSFFGTIREDGKAIQIHTQSDNYALHATQTTQFFVTTTTCDGVHLDHKDPRDLFLVRN